MKTFLRTTWFRLCNLIKTPSPVQTSLRDKAIAVAGRVSVVADAESGRASCPVCLSVLCASSDSDMRMLLAVHMSLWHPDDVKLQWDIMQKKRDSVLHVPSVVIGVGIAAGIGALLAFAAKNHGGALVGKGKRLPAFKSR